MWRTSHWERDRVAVLLLKVRVPQMASGRDIEAAIDASFSIGGAGSIARAPRRFPANKYVGALLAAAAS